MCPSDSVLTISLGPTNPQSTIVAEETLIFRRRCFSHRLWLLVPTFLLCNAPEWVTPSPSSRCKHSPTAHIFRRIYKPQVSVLCLSPDYLWRKISWWVSCYAIFKGLLLLSKPPHCQRNLTSLLALSIDLGTLSMDLGCFPFDQWSFAPTV